MIDNEINVFQALSSALREKYGDDIFVAGEEITSAPPRFPAVTVVQNDNEINTRYASFDSRENVVIEEYKIEAYSNLQEQYDRVMQTKSLARTISEVMDGLGYLRTFNRPIANADKTISRRVLRFRKSNLTEVS